MIMNDIKNTMCRLSDLTQEQIKSLVDAMPRSPYFDFNEEEFIGANVNSDWGTWDNRFHTPTIILYSNMMQLLKGKDMNKQTAQEQMAVMQIEMDKLKAIIDKPEAKTGRVLGLDCLKRNAEYWYVWNSVERSSMDGDEIDKSRIQAGNAFHDRETAKRHLEYLKLEQELRRAQVADGGAGKEVIAIYHYRVKNSTSFLFHKVSFNTQEARDKFRKAHTDEQLTLLIRGV
jgi:hypothetical protein